VERALPCTPGARSKGIFHAFQFLCGLWRPESLVFLFVQQVLHPLSHLTNPFEKSLKYAPKDIVGKVERQTTEDFYKSFISAERVNM